MRPEFLHRRGTGCLQPTPLLFVHGAFTGAWCWDEHFLPFFQQQGYDCGALNFRGHGANTVWCRLQQLGIADYVRDLVWALEQFPTPPVLISHSMGAFVTLRMLQRRPTHLAGLILMSPASERSHFAAALRLLRDFPVLCCKLSFMNYLPKHVWPWWMTTAEVHRLMLSRASSLETSERLLPRMQHESLRAMMDMLRSGGAQPPRMQFPALVLSGAEDVVVPPEFVRRTADWLQAEMRVEPQLGHAMMLEDGWQTAAEHILTWLQSQPQWCGRGRPRQAV